MRKSLLDALRSRILLSDGAMGTQLQLAGLRPGESGELWNVTEPEKVKEIQRRYADAGSDMLLTNTFGGSRLALARNKLADRTGEINEAAARLAREVMGEDRWVIGDIGPYGGMIEPYGDDAPEEVEESFFVQALGLLRGGADALIVETQTALEEAECGVKACRRALLEAGLEGRIPVIVSMAYDRTINGPPRTMMGVDPLRAAETLASLGIDIIGCNCGKDLDIAAYCEIVRLYKEGAPGIPIIAQPNAGNPQLIGGRIIYHEMPEAMAKGVAGLVESGAVIVGGCCGTTPDHIRFFRKELDIING